MVGPRFSEAEAIVNQVLDQLEKFVEKASQPGVLGLAGRKVEKQCARELGTYFKNLGRRVEKLHLEDLTKEPAATADQAKAVVRARLHNVLRMERASLVLVLKSNLHSAYVAGRNHDHLAEAQPFNQLGDSARDAVAWAEQQAGDLVTGLDNTSIDLIADSVAQGIESQVGPAGTARLIKEAVDEMSSSRAFTIASTEMNRAFSLAAMDGFDASGIEYKQIVLSPEACPVCVDNAADDPLPVDEEYDSGDLYPPFHPNCRCAITGARAPEDEDPINV